MLQLLPHAGATFRYQVSGTLSAADLVRFYAALNEQFSHYGRLIIMVEVTDFRGYAGWSALSVLLKHEPGLLWKVKQYHAVSNQRWFRFVISAVNIIVPHIRFRATSSES